MGLFFWLKRVPGRGLEWRESGKTVLSLQIIILILISCIIIKLLTKKWKPSKPTLQTELHNHGDVYVSSWSIILVVTTDTTISNTLGRRYGPIRSLVNAMSMVLSYFQGPVL